MNSMHMYSCMYIYKLTYIYAQSIYTCVTVQNMVFIVIWEEALHRAMVLLWCCEGAVLQWCCDGAAATTGLGVCGLGVWEVSAVWAP